MNIESIKSQFPIFSQKTPFGKDFIYLDNAATSQKPQSVIDAIQHYYSHEYSTVGRGAYWPANSNTPKLNEVRQKVKKLINASSEKEIIFTSGTTDGINKIARTYVAPLLQKGNQLMISAVEHHANLLPWQALCGEKDAELIVIPILENGHLDYEWLEKHIKPSVKFLAISACSNVLGVNNDLSRISSLANRFQIPILVDAAQSLSHQIIDVQELNIDFLVFSAHKIYGPTGIGVLYGKELVLSNLAPFNLGGGIVTEVTFEKTDFQGLPQRHEAGTPNIAGIFGLGAAIDFLNSWNRNEVNEYLNSLTGYALDKLSEVEGLNILGGPEDKAPVISFTLDQIHPHDAASFLNEEGICVRAGHHCAQPLMHYLGIPASLRISFAPYNLKKDIDRLIESLIQLKLFFND